MNRIFVLSLLSIFFVGCGNIEDTYKEYAGDGPIRYIGKPIDVVAAPAWERVELSWINNVDPIIKSIIVRWSADGDTKEVILPNDATSYTIDKLDNFSYEVNVVTVDAEGNESLPTINYVRPYTAQHELAVSFPRIVTKIYLVKDRMVLFFADWNDDIINATIDYYDTSGNMVSLEINEDYVDDGYVLVDGTVDTNRDVMLNRKGYLGENMDVVDFEAIKLEQTLTVSSDLRNELIRVDGNQEITYDYLNSIDTLNINYSVNTIEDILLMSSLEHVNLGKERYIMAPNSYYMSDNAKFNGVSLAKFIMRVMYDVYGTTFSRYSPHFDLFLWGDQLDYLTEYPTPEPIPNYPFIDINAEGVSYENSVDDDNNTMINYLFDGDYTTRWASQPTQESRVHTITIDLGNATTLNGMQVAQRQIVEYSDDEFLPTSIIVEVSEDNIAWDIATYEESARLGYNNGEVTDIKFRALPSNSTYRYIRFTVAEVVEQANYSVTLSEVKIY